MATQYIMKATHINSAPLGTVYWTVQDSPDLTGTFSGYNPADLTGIAVDYTTTLSGVATSGNTVSGSGGDLSGTYPNPTVSKLQGKSVSSTAPIQGDVLVWNNSNSTWAPTQHIVPVVAPFANRPNMVAGQMFYPTDGGFTQISDGKDWYNIIGGTLLKEPPSLSTLTVQTNYGTTTTTKTKGTIAVNAQLGTLQIRCLGKPIANISEASITACASLVAPGANYNNAAIYMRETSTGKILSIGQTDGTAGLTGFTRQVWNSATSRLSFTDFSVPQYGTQNAAPLMFRMVVSGTTVNHQLSYDGGLSWGTVGTNTFASAFTTAPNEFGIGFHVEQTVANPLMTYYHLSFTGDSYQQITDNNSGTSISVPTPTYSNPIHTTPRMPNGNYIR